MKKTIIICVLTLFTIKTAYSQSSFSVGTKWTYVADYFYEDIFDTLVSFYVEKDTIINQKLCYKVNHDYLSIYGLNGLYEILYEEGKQIYIYNSQANNFKLLYDFEAKKGDSWQYAEGRIIQVDSVSSFLFMGQILTCLHLSYLQPDDLLSKGTRTVVMEKFFGDFFFLPYFIVSDDIPDFVPKNLVKYENDTLTVDSVEINQIDCSLVVGGVDEKVFHSKITYSPNPAKDILNLTGFEYEKLESYQLYNTIGDIIEVKFTGSSLDVSNLEKGVYFLRLNLSRGVSILKFIKE